MEQQPIIVRDLATSCRHAKGPPDFAIVHSAYLNTDTSNIIAHGCHHLKNKPCTSGDPVTSRANFANSMLSRLVSSVATGKFAALWTLSSKHTIESLGMLPSLCAFERQANAVISTGCITPYIE